MTNENDTKCQCGRDATRVHCPGCGSQVCYSTPSKARVEMTTEGPLRVMAYRCRRCGGSFDDLDRTRCDAPIPSKGVGVLRRVDAAVTAVAAVIGADDSLSYDERKAKLFDLLKQAKKQPRGEQE
jgi:hypothetical protein